MITGLGITEKNIQEDTWTRTYSCVTGVYGDGELQALTALPQCTRRIFVVISGIVMKWL